MATLKEHIPNPTTVYIDPEYEGNTVGQYVVERLSKFYPYPQFDSSTSPFDPSSGPDPSPGPGPSPGPTPDPSSWEYDGDGNGTPDVIDDLQREQQQALQDRTWGII